MQTELPMSQQWTVIFRKHAKAEDNYAAGRRFPEALEPRTRSVEEPAPARRRSA